ncbi:MAG: AAA family ATPase [Magnetococcus sp. DMHC-6]
MPILSIFRTEAKSLYQIQLDQANPSRLISFSHADPLHQAIQAWRYLFSFTIYSATGTPSKYIIEDALLNAGLELFHHFIAPDWAYLQASQLPGKPIQLTIAADDLDILNLPWELLYPTDLSYMGLSTQFAIRRFSNHKGKPLPRCLVPSPAPLRVLFIIATPSDQPVAELEAWQLGLLETVAPFATAEMAWFLVDGGEWEHLEVGVKKFQPHIVLMAGSVLIRQSQGFFCFEEGRGQADPRSGAEIGRELFANSGVQMVLVAARSSGQPPPTAALSSLCQQLVHHDVPVALTLPFDPEGLAKNGFLRHFLQQTLAGQTIDAALSMARSFSAHVSVSIEPVWSLPALFTATTQERLFNSTPNAPSIPPIFPTQTLFPLSGLQEGYVADFRGRRGMVHTYLEDFVQGKYPGLFLTGESGIGKTALASLFAHHLTTRGFTPLALTLSSLFPLRCHSILSAFTVVLEKVGLYKESQLLSHPDISLTDRLGFLLRILNDRHPFILILDGLESQLSSETRAFNDLEFGTFFYFLCHKLYGQSRLIVTSCILPEGMQSSSDTLNILPLSPMPNSYFATSLQHTFFGEQREELIPLVAAYQRVFGSIPRHWRYFLQVARFIPVVLLEQKLKEAAEQLEAEQEGQKRVQQREKWALELFYTPLFQNLSADSQLALGQLARMDIPLTFKEIQQMTGIELHHFNEWQKFEWIHTAGKIGHQELWLVPAYLCAWLCQTVVLTTDQTKALHKQAGDLCLALAYSTHQTWRGMTPFNLFAASLRHFQIAAYPDMQVKLLFDLAELEQTFGAVASALGRYHHALLLLQAQEDQTKIAAVLAKIGFIHLNRGESGTALEHFGRAVEIYRQSSNSEGLCDLLPWIADIQFRQGQIDPARASFQEVLPLLRRAKRSQMEARVLHQLAIVDLNEGDLPVALNGFRRSLALKRRLEDRQGEAATFYQLGRLAKEMDLQEDALRLLGLCYVIDNAIGNPDAESELTLYRQIAETMGVSMEESESILAELWRGYQEDRGQGLLDKLNRGRLFFDFII